LEKTSVKSFSTSSFRRLPWAGLLALVLLLAVDRVALGPHGIWGWLAIDDPNSAARSRLELQQLRAAPSGQPRVVVVGTSRVIDGFDPAEAKRLMPGTAFAKMGYPRFEPFTIRLLVDDLIDSGADAVCLIASAQDTHRPLRLEPVPGSSGASLAALWDLVREAGPAFAVENRTSLYRLAASSLLNAYRFRVDLRRAGLDDLRRFPLEPRLGKPPYEPDDPFRPTALWGAERNPPPPPPARRSTMDLFPPLMDQWQATLQAGTMQEITRGEHVAVQMALYRRAVQRLREAGIEVVIIEGTAHPAAADFYDTSIRADFRAFADALVEDFGVRFVRLTEMAPLAESDFYDLLHTNAEGAAKITAGMVSGLRQTPIDWPH
jgi:hypothetical protein